MKRVDLSLSQTALGFQVLGKLLNEVSVEVWIRFRPIHDALDEGARLVRIVVIRNRDTGVGYRRSVAGDCVSRTGFFCLDQQPKSNACGVGGPRSSLHREYCS